MRQGAKVGINKGNEFPPDQTARWGSIVAMMWVTATTLALLPSLRMTHAFMVGHQTTRQYVKSAFGGSSSFILNNHNETSSLSISSSASKQKDCAAAESRLSKNTAARCLVDTLVENDVDTFFGICGGPAGPLFEAIRLNPDARFIQSRHETNAAFACSIYYRATGKPAVLVVTAGPGITNAVNGIASASAEEDAMLVVAGDVDWQSSGRILLQDSGPRGVDAEGTLRAFTREQIRVPGANSIIGCAMAALEGALNPRRPGPALLVVPIHVATDVLTADLPVALPAVSLSAKVHPSVLEKVATALLFSRRPLIVIGSKCRSYHAEVEALVQSAEIPFVLTAYAKGLLRENQPWSLHNCGLGHKRFIDHYASNGSIDVVLAIGTDLDDAETASLDLSATELYHVHTDATVFNRNVPTTLAIVSDAGSFCRDLQIAIEKKCHAKGPQNECVQLTKARASAREAYNRAKVQSPFPFDVFNDTRLEPIKSCRAVLDLQAAMPDNTRFITDMGDHTFVTASFLEVKHHNTFFYSLKLASMGSGIGGAIGLGVADPNSYIVAIVGDGGMQMYGMEVLVALKYNLPIVFAVFNNGGYGMVHHGMKAAWGQADAYDCPRVDFSRWARSMGITGTSINRGGHLTPKLMEQLVSEAGGGPIVLDISVDADFFISNDRVKCLDDMFTGPGKNSKGEH